MSLKINELVKKIVPVLKKDSSIRLCADYRVTVNPFLKDDHHPLPIIDEIFAAMQGGKHFPKLDLKNAYYQLEVDEETKKLLTWSTHRTMGKNRPKIALISCR